jgi:hypothetical protein
MLCSLRFCLYIVIITTIDCYSHSIMYLVLFIYRTLGNNLAKNSTCVVGYIVFICLPIELVSSGSHLSDLRCVCAQFIHMLMLDVVSISNLEIALFKDTCL